jgi:TPR repeat protein
MDGKDDREAARLYNPAADRGNAVAQVNLGVMYGEGRGVPEDYAAALSRYRKAADQGPRRCSILSRGHVRQRPRCPAGL